FGNFINRVVVLTNKYYDGIVPKPGEFSEVDEQTLAELKAYPAVIASSIDRYRFREAQGELMNVARLGNKYLADEEPWKLIKTDEERVKTIMYVALQIASALATLSEPFLPFTAEKLKRMLDHGKSSSEATINTGGATPEISEENEWEQIGGDAELLPAGHQIGKAELLFSKIEDEQIQKQLDKLEATKAANLADNKKAEPQKETATFEDFSKMDLRVGTIVEAAKMPKANKLLVLKVDTGLDVRTIVSGIAESFKPEDIIGKKVTVLVNLAPRKLRGVESEGMILMTENASGKLVFLNPDEDGVKEGTVIS
ncbi:MAG: methionine--tRNA ligase subunit beta, partial [Salinimicrobium sediminis]|nr:methionine--tRNA ligase subunit beta [Salinimicrobium sediminis]